MFLRQSTASQEILLGRFLDSTDGNTEETALSIANTDIKIFKNGTTAQANKNSGGGTHDAGGMYSAVLDATDTDTLGQLEVNVHVTGALAVRREYTVLPATVYDAIVLGTDNLDVNVAQWLGTAAATPTVAGVPEVDMTHMAGGTQTVTDLKDFADAGYDPATNKVQGVVLVDTTTANTDMRGTDSAATATALATAQADLDIITGASGVNLLTATQASIDAIESDTGVILVDTADMQPKLGTPAGASISADIVVIDNFVDGIESTLGTPIDFGSGTSTIAANLQDIADDGTAVYDRSTDSLTAIRDRGDAAWVTGAGGADKLVLQDTTIATLSTQTSFTLTAGSADNDAYNNCTVVVEDVSTATQKAVGMVLDYVGSSKTITLKEALAFTIAATDKVYILAENSIKSTVSNRQLDVTATGGAGIDWANVENPATALDLSGTDIQLVDTTTVNTDMRGTDSGATAADLATAQSDLDIITGASGVNLLTATQASIDAIEVDTGTTLQAELDAIQAAVITNAAGVDIAADIIAVKDDTAAILVDTAQIGTAGAGLTDLGGMSTDMKAEINVEADTALTDYDPPTNTELEARTPTASQLAYIVAHAATAKPVTFSGTGTTTTGTLALVDGNTPSAVNDHYNGRVLIFNAGTLNEVATDITNYVGSTKVVTVIAVPFAIASSHTALLV